MGGQVMIATLVDVAKALASYEQKKRGWNLEQIVLHRLCKSPIKGDEILKVLVLDVQNQKVRLEDYKDEERWKYLYALSTGNHSVGPSWLLNFRKSQSTQKTRKEIIQTGLKEIRASLPNNIVQDLKKWEAEGLLDDLEERTKSEKSVLLTIVWDGKMPGEHPAIREEFERRKILGERRAKEGEGCCAICGKKDKVFSAIPFRFFTVEKLGFSPMGREEHVWKYAPVCEDCAKWLHVAESYLEENLRTRVIGKSAYLVPDLEPGVAEIEGSFIHFLWEWRDRTEGKMVPRDDFPAARTEKRAKKKGGDSEIDEEPDSLQNLFEGLVEESDKRFKDHPPFRSASLVFYQPGQKFMFLYTISEILPTNLREAKSRLEGLRKLLQQGALGDGGSELAPQLRADFKFVGDAWKWPRKGQTESQGILRLTPLHLVEAILTERRPHEREFWQDADSLLRAIYQETISSKDQKQTVREALAERVILIWAIWTLIYCSTKLEGDENMATSDQEKPQESPKECSTKLEGDENMATPTTTQPATAEATTEFWDEFFKLRLLLDSPSKRAAFLVGVLFGQVESKQRSERQSKAGEMPIVSRLKGLTISRQDLLKNLYCELMLKLRQLDANTRAIRVIQQAAADFASQGGELSDEEARFCFCLGWALSWTTVNAVREALGSREGEEAEEVSAEEETEGES
jgi:hypothetical protein